MIGMLELLLPVLIAIRISERNRKSCKWKSDEVISQLLGGILLIALFFIALFAPHEFVPIPVVLLAKPILWFGAYLVARAFFRTRDLERSTICEESAHTNGVKMSRLMRNWIIYGACVGCGFGYLSAEYFPLFGDLAMMTSPNSPVRNAAIPGHILLWTILLAAAGCGVGWLADKREAILYGIC